MAELILRDYQSRLVADIRDAWTRTRAVLAWMPTGAGKTEVSVYLAQAEAAAGGCTLFVVDRKTLAGQARNRYSTRYGMLTGLIRGEDTYVRGYEPAIVATVQSLRARAAHAEVRAVLERVTLVVMDEAHIRFKHHEALIEALPNARVLGLTATPLRDGLGQTFGELARGPDYERLIESGYLVRPRYFLPHTDDIRDGLARVGVASTGDYVQGELGALMRRKTIVGDVVETWTQKADNRRTIVFCVDRAHSREACDAFLMAGIAAEHIDLHTGEDERRAMFRRFREGVTRVLCSIVVLAVGFDEPGASCAILARPTLSLSMHIQQIGRVMRAAPDKSDCLVLDHAGNVLRHGRVEAFEPPELSRIDKRSDRAEKNSSKDYFPCPECRAVLEPGQRVCPECGHEIARKNTVDFVPGRLVEDDRRDQPNRDELRELYLELRGVAKARGYRDGWAFCKLRDEFGFKAPYGWKGLTPRPPTPATLSLVRSWHIRFSKEQKRRQGSMVA